jgi:predicted TIM-barrel fold metal-dependent hydrolase
VYADKREMVWNHWRLCVAELAACPNVYMKLGGGGMGVFGFGWNERPAPPTSAEYAAAVAPLFLHCIETMGADHCMFESNFPVDRLACSYVTTWNAFVRVAAGASPTERAALFHDTAVKAYRL